MMVVSHSRSDRPKLRTTFMRIVFVSLSEPSARTVSMTRENSPPTERHLRKESEALYMTSGSDLLTLVLSVSCETNKQDYV